MKRILTAFLVVSMAIFCAMAETDEGIDLDINFEAPDFYSDVLEIDDQGINEADVATDGTLNNILQLDDILIEDEREPFDTSVQENTSAISNSFTDGGYDHDAFEIDANGVLVKYHGNSGKVVIPQGVAAIGDKAFYGCTSVMNVSIPDSVKSIGEYAFSGCTRMKSITIPDGVTRIDMMAFEECDAIKYASMNSDGAKALSRAGYFFRVLGNNYDLQYGERDDEISDLYIWNVDKDVTSLMVPKGVTVIGESAFQDCRYLKSVLIPDSVTCIFDFAFKDCTSLKSVSIPNSVTDIGWQAFYGCTSLDSVLIPDSVRRIGKSVFAYCNKLTSVKIPDSEISLRNTFYKCTSLENVTIPKSITCIEESAFADCVSLNDVIIMNGEITIDDDAFEGCPANMTFHTPCKSATVKWVKSKGYTVEEIHTPVIDPAVLATYAETGLTEGSHCSVCGEVLVKQEVIPKLTPPVEVKLNKSKATLYAGKTLTLKATVKPSKAKTTLTWTSRNKKVATVTSKGVVKALKKGTATITVTTANGKKATCKITVPAAPTKVTLNKKKATLKVGKKLTLKATLTPAKARTTFTWTSSNKKVATVSKKGVVKAIKPGKAKITVRTANGKKATVTITVKK